LVVWAIEFIVGDASDKLLVEAGASVNSDFLAGALTPAQALCLQTDVTIA